MRTFFIIVGKYITPYKGYAFLNLLFNLLGVLFSLISLVLIGPFLNILFGLQEVSAELLTWHFSKEVIINNLNYYISDLIINHGAKAALFSVSGIVLVMFLMKTSNIYLANYFMAPIRNGVVRDLRNSIYKKILELPISYYTQEKKGDIMARVSQDVQEVEWSIMASLVKMFRDPIHMVIFLLGMFLMSPGLTAFVLILLPFSAFIIGHIGKNLRKTSKKSQSQMGLIMSILEETLSGLRIIKSFNAELAANKKFRNENQKYVQIMNRISRRRDLASPLSEFLGAIVVVGLLAYGGNLVLMGDGQLSPSSFIAYIAIFSQLLSPAKSFSTAYYHMNKGLASFDRINEVLETPIGVKEAVDPVAKHSFDSSIEFRSVDFAYQDEKVLKSVSLSIQRGNTYALVGASGSGKSTFIDLMLRFHDPGHGSIEIDGINSRSLIVKDLRNLFGYVPQESLLFNDSFTNNIAFGDTSPDPARIEQAAQLSDSIGFISSNNEGFDATIGDRGGKLSGGQRQRIGIARALYVNRPILVLDEATSALDNESEKRVYDALRTHLENTTILIVAHRLTTIQRADVIIVFKNGEIIDHGKHEELLTRCMDYQRLYQEEQMEDKQ